MDPIVKRQDQELVNVIRNAAIKLFDAEDGPNVREALDELERRHCNRGSVLARLARVEEDLAKLHEAHVTHRHGADGLLDGFSEHTAEQLDATNPWGKGYATREDLEVLRKQVAERIFPGTGKAALAMFPGAETGRVSSTQPHIEASLLRARDNAENRAWCLIEEWRALEIKKPENAGNVYEVRIKPPVSTDDWDAEIILESLSENGPDYTTHRCLVVSKRGTSRVDALARLASWCQAEMPLQPVPCCQHEGSCGVGVPKCVQETVSLVEVGVPSTEHPHKVAKYTP